MSPFKSPDLAQNYHSKYVEKIVWKISNLNKSRHPIYKVQNFLTGGFEIYAIWVECLVNKMSQIPDVNSGFIRYIVAQIR